MEQERILPDEPLDFIKRCAKGRLIHWTYHMNMRMASRNVTRQMIVESVDEYKIIESYPDDKYMPSYLIRSVHDGTILHILFATDVPNKNVRVVTAYRPNPVDWNEDCTRRRFS